MFVIIAWVLQIIFYLSNFYKGNKYLFIIAGIIIQYNTYKTLVGLCLSNNNTYFLILINTLIHFCVNKVMKYHILNYFIWNDICSSFKIFMNWFIFLKQKFFFIFNSYSINIRPTYYLLFYIVITFSQKKIEVNN